MAATSGRESSAFSRNFGKLGKQQEEHQTQMTTLSPAGLSDISLGDLGGGRVERPKINAAPRGVIFRGQPGAGPASSCRAQN